jgi:hypothetical protein
LFWKHVLSRLVCGRLVQRTFDVPIKNFFAKSRNAGVDSGRAGVVDIYRPLYLFKIFDISSLQLQFVHLEVQSELQSLVLVSRTPPTKMSALDRFLASQQDTSPSLHSRVLSTVPTSFHVWILISPDSSSITHGAGTNASREIPSSFAMHQ